jgi:hypothetical protein
MSFPPRKNMPSASAVLKVNFSFRSEVAEAKSLLSRNRYPRRDAYQSQQGMMINEATKKGAKKSKYPYRNRKNKPNSEEK